MKTHAAGPTTRVSDSVETLHQIWGEDQESVFLMSSPMLLWLMFQDPVLKTTGQ